MADLFPDLKTLARSEYLFRITDNGGATADRYTVATSDGDYLCMSGSPSHPQGVSMFGEGFDPEVFANNVEAETEIDLALGDLPENIQRHILARFNQGFEDYLESLEAGEGVPTSREAAEENEGLMDSVGDGLYRLADGWRVRREGVDPTDDYGPFETAAEALRATLPTPYSCAGNDYHSTTDVNRLEPSEEVAALVKALEEREDARADAEWSAKMDRMFPDPTPDA